MDEDEAEVVDEAEEDEEDEEGLRRGEGEAAVVVDSLHTSRCCSQS